MVVFSRFITWLRLFPHIFDKKKLIFIFVCSDKEDLYILRRLAETYNFTKSEAFNQILQFGFDTAKTLFERRENDVQYG